MTTDDLTPERARELLAADGQEVTDFTDAILAAWERDRARLAAMPLSVGEQLATDEADQVRRLKAWLGFDGESLAGAQVEALWQEHSDDYCASWLIDGHERRAAFAGWLAHTLVRDRARLAYVERLIDSLVGCGNAVFNTRWSDGLEMRLHLANAHRNALSEAVVSKAVHLAELRARLATVLAQRDALVHCAEWGLMYECTPLTEEAEAAVRVILDAIRAERATTGGTDADA